MDKIHFTVSVFKYALVLSTFTTCILTLEEPNPEVFLEPRNFNPHPYETPQRRNGNGPVLFPSNPEDNLIENRNQVVTLVKTSRRLKNRHPVDSNPYTKVARKQRYRITGQFENENNEVSNRDYQALAKHASKVLSYPPEQLRKTYNPLDEDRRGKDYAFSYKVLDHLTGDDFSHSQTRNSKATNGEYRVKLPDGRVQIVSYTADKNGYKADVKYTENEGDAAQRETSHQGQNLHVGVPVNELYNLMQDEKPVEYHDDDDERQESPRVLLVQAIVPTQIPGHYARDVVVTPGPAYLKAADNKDLQSHNQPRVEIYTTNARDYSVGSYVPATVAPYLPTTIIPEGRPPISPQIISSGDNGLYIPSSTPSFIVTDQHGQVLDNIKLVSTTASPLLGQNYIASSTPSSLLRQNYIASSTPSSLFRQNYIASTTPSPLLRQNFIASSTPSPFIISRGRHRSAVSTIGDIY